MGAGASSVAGTEEQEDEGETGLGDMPESCVAAVLIYLDPPEICSVAKLNRAFRGAASADYVWAAKLPKNYEYLVGLAAEEGGFKSGLSMKEIFAQLCRPNPFDGGTKEFWLMKSRSEIGVSISSKALAITGIDDRRYWNHMQTDESRFNSVAYLQQIWWLEVAGEIELCFPAGSYCLFFRLHLGRPCKRLGRWTWTSDHIHGWDIRPVSFRLWVSGQPCATSQYHLDEQGNWALYHVGDFFVEGSDMPTKLKFSMTQIDCTHMKGGLCVDSVLIYPMGFRQDKDFVVHM